MLRVLPGEGGLGNFSITVYLSCRAGNPLAYYLEAEPPFLLRDPRSCEWKFDCSPIPSRHKNHRFFGIFAGRMERIRPTLLLENGGLFEHFRCLRAGWLWNNKLYHSRSQRRRNTSGCSCCFMRKELTLVNGYFEVTIPAYLSGEFENHFRMTDQRVSYWHKKRYK